jgi:hypothetical protein
VHSVWEGDFCAEDKDPARPRRAPIQVRPPHRGEIETLQSVPSGAVAHLSAHTHLDDAVKQPETVKEGHVALGKAARHQAEAGDGTGPNPVAPPKGAPTPSAHERLRRQAEGQR